MMQIKYLAAVAVIAAMIFASGAGATTITDSSYNEYKAEIVSSAADVTVNLNGILPNKNTQSAAGDTSASPITMSTGNDQAQTALTKGNWAYMVTIECTASTTASTTFNVTLSRDGTVVDSLYVASDGTPAVGEDATATFDLGTASLNSAEAFLLTVDAV